MIFKQNKKTNNMKIITIFSALLLVTTLSSCHKEPTACFSMDKTSAQVGETVTFTDCSKDITATTLKPGVLASGVPIALFFENGTAQFTYNSAGTYTVELEALNCKNGNKCKSDVITQTISVEP